MQFELNETQLEVRNQVRRLLSDKGPRSYARRALDTAGGFDESLWERLAVHGFLGAAIPEAYGGNGAGYVELCVIAEEIGRAVAPVPMASSVFLATELLLIAGTRSQKSELLPRIAEGKSIVSVAFAEGPGNPQPEALTVSMSQGLLHGIKTPVLDGDIADHAIVLCKGEPDSGAGGLGLYLVDLKGHGVRRRSLKCIDPTRNQAAIEFDGAKASPLTGTSDAWKAFSKALDRAAVLTAFEQLGGAQAALEMAQSYALERFAFGRPIGSFQSIKHKLADMYIASTLARSNCYHGAWALNCDSPELAEAAALARISSTEAYRLCSKENIQIHGGIGYTWESDCHLYYRRANLLALTLGSLSLWNDRLFQALHDCGTAVEVNGGF